MDKILDSVPYFDEEIDFNDNEQGCINIASKVRPYWKIDEIKLKNFKAGYINKVVGCFVSDFKDAIVIRVFGNLEDFMIPLDRKKEMVIAKVLAEHDLYPGLVCAFKNGMCVKYLEGNQYSWSIEDSLKPLREDEKACNAMARTMGRLHSQAIQAALIKNGVEIPENANAMSEEANIAMIENQFPDNLEDQDKQKRIKEFPSKEEWKKEINFLAEKTKKMKLKIGFGNLDLNPTNFVYNKEEDKARVVDLDAVGMTYYTHDLCALIAGIWYGIEVNPEVYLPDKEWQLKVIKSYLDVDKEAGIVTDDDIQKLYQALQFCYMMYHFDFALFIFVSCRNEKPFFDHIDDLTYAKARLERYYLMKEQYLKNEL